MPALRRIDLQPGNAEACPQAPAGSSFKVCSVGDVLCVSQLPYNDSLCQGSPYPDDGGGSSFPVAAVAVPVAVVGAAVIATWAYWWWRRRRRAAARRAASVQHEQQKQQQQQLQQPSVGKDWAGQVRLA